MAVDIEYLTTTQIIDFIPRVNLYRYFVRLNQINVTSTKSWKKCVIQMTQ